MTPDDLPPTDATPPGADTPPPLPGTDEAPATAEPADAPLGAAPVAAAPALPAQPVPPVPPAPQAHDLSRIAQDLQIRKQQVEAVVQLLDDGNTVPFVTRYRKERTGGLDEEHAAADPGTHRLTAARALAERKQTILRSIALQGKLTDPISSGPCWTPTAPEAAPKTSTCRTSRRRRRWPRTRKEKGLEQLAALAIWNRGEAVDEPARNARRAW